MKGLMLFFIAVFGTSIMFLFSTIFSIIYYLVHFWKVKEAYGKIDKFFYDMAHSVDQFGNVNCQNLFNHVMIKRTHRKAVKDTSTYDHAIYHRFGDVDDTISYILADNKVKGALSPFGSFWGKFLDFVDKDHLQKAIVNKIKEDKKAKSRLTYKWVQPEYEFHMEKSRNTNV